MGAKKQMYSKEDITRIFDSEKILLGSEDVIKRDKAIEILGENAVYFVCAHKKYGEYWGAYRILRYGKRYSIAYLTYKGFLCAASYSNALSCIENK